MTKQTPNRLSAEKSPYLLQHANNPVDWYPWGDEAFEHARAQDKPIFLSIGYSTCHWCHVMERESFEDDEVAELLNEHFVAIKVDREERPDVDQQYMDVCQALTGSGGWPLTAVLTPAGEAFFAGTYFPKTSRFGRAGMMELLPQIAELWRERRAEAVRAAAEITRAVHQPRRPTTATTAATGAKATTGTGPTEAWLREGFDQLNNAYDQQHGGFGGRPKFPQPLSLLFLLRYWRRTGEARALAAVEETLRHMRLGGVYDQLGGGFHRYATDQRWFLPHFEKMLYDQALLTLAYTEAYQATGKAQYRAVAEGILAYVLRDLTAPDGGFYSAEDADSEGVEGKFYVWTAAELQEALGPDLADDFLQAYGARTEGNFAEEATGEPTGTNILYLADEKLWAALGQAQPDRFADARRALLDRRGGRVRPLRDDKILTDWNGLMIAALARAGGVFDEPAYTAAASRAAAFILAARKSHDGRLLHRYREGEWLIPAFLDDYANLAWGLIELYNATWQATHLRSALEISESSWEELGDPASDGLFFAPPDASGTLIRRKTAYDGATPSGNAVTANNLLHLGRLLARPDLEDRAASVMRYLAAESAGQAWGHALFFCALDYAIGPTQEVVISGDPAQPATKDLREEVKRGFSPRRTVLHLPAAPDRRAAVTGLAPFTANLPDPAGAAAAYVCEGGACQTPISDPEQLRAALTSRPRR